MNDPWPRERVFDDEALMYTLTDRAMALLFETSDVDDFVRTAPSWHGKPTPEWAHAWLKLRERCRIV